MQDSTVEQDWEVQDSMETLDLEGSMAMLAWVQLGLVVFMELVLLEVLVV